MKASSIIQNKPISVEDWYNLIASKSKCPLVEVKNILDRYGIQPQVTTPIRKAIRFHKLSFNGTKVGTKNDGDFSFEWDNLNAGLYGILSEDNSVGKSSILRLFYGSLRGDFSGVSEPVMGWIDYFFTKFSVGEIHFELHLNRQEEGLNATLIRSSGSTKIKEYCGPDSGLAAIIEQLLMKEMEFERMFATKDSKSLVSHGWPALASALFISGSEGAVIGDLTLSGLPQRLLQLFIGLPWISTHSRASAIQKIEEASRKSVANDKTGRNMVSSALARLKEELGNLPDTKLIEEQRNIDRQRQNLLDRNIDKNILSSKQLRSNIEKIAAELSALKAELLQMKRLNQSLEDDMAAGFIFRKLQPVCCPSCESTTFKLNVSTEANDNQCPLCKEKNPILEPKDKNQIIELQTSIVAVESKINQLSKEHESKLDKLNLAMERIENDKNELNEIVEKRESDISMDEVAMRRVSLEATIAELNKLGGQENVDKTYSHDEIAVLKAAVSETKKMYQEKEIELFRDASKLLKETAETLGVKHLVDVVWTSTKLTINIANREITYSKLSPGERLRFRIAASISIAKLAASTGQGRHPGILFFDSPKSEEITDTDFQEILFAITQLTKDDNSLQVFVASRVPKNYKSKVLFKEIKHAVGKDFLF